MFSSCRLQFIIFITVVNGIIIDNNIDHNLRLCKDIVETFFRGQTSVTVFKDRSSKHLFRSEVIRLIQTIAPILVYDGISESLVERIHDMGDELNVPSVTKSYLAMSESADWISLNLNLFASVNTNGKWIFFLVNVEKSAAESLLKEAFEKHKMLNVLVIFVNQKSKVFVGSFNPFQLNGENRRGKIWLQEVKRENLSQISGKIERKFNKKFKNLQRFELKVSTFYEASKTSDIINEAIPELFKKTLNCKLKYFETSDGIYGSRLPNGSFTG